MARQGTELKTEISAGASVRGTLRGAEDLVVRGRVEGTITLDGALFVEAGGVVKADVTADRVMIAGALVGDVTARTSIEIAAQGRVIGDLVAPSLRTEPGARFAGQLSIGDEVAPREARPEPEVRVAPPPKPVEIAEPEAPTERPRSSTPVTTFSPTKTPHDERKKRRVVIKKRSR